jgi:predicted ATPase
MSTIKITRPSADDLASCLFNINETLSDLNDRIKILECAAVGYANSEGDTDIACGFTTHFQDVLNLINQIRCGDL